MALQMVRPTRHPRTGVWRIRQPIPPRLRETTKRLHGVSREFVRTLGTKTQGSQGARGARHRDVLRVAPSGRSGTRWPDRSANRPRCFCPVWQVACPADRDAQGSHGEGAAYYSDMASELGEIAQGLEDDDEEYPGNPHKDAVEAMEEDVEPLLAAAGLAVNSASRERLSARLLVTRWQFLRDLAERTRSGRWVQTISANDFPAGTVEAAKPETGCTFDLLLRGFALDRGWGGVDAKPVPRALYDRQRTLERLAIFLGHRNAERVTKADGVRWKEEALRRHRTAATVRNDLWRLNASSFSAGVCLGDALCIAVAQKDS